MNHSKAAKQHTTIHGPLTPYNGRSCASQLSLISTLRRKHISSIIQFLHNVVHTIIKMRTSGNLCIRNIRIYFLWYNTAGSESLQYPEMIISLQKVTLCLILVLSSSVTPVGCNSSIKLKNGAHNRCYYNWHSIYSSLPGLHCYLKEKLFPMPPTAANTHIRVEILSHRLPVQKT